MLKHTIHRGRSLTIRPTSGGAASPIAIRWARDPDRDSDALCVAVDAARDDYAFEPGPEAPVMKDAVQVPVTLWPDYCVVLTPATGTPAVVTLRWQPGNGGGMRRVAIEFPSDAYRVGADFNRPPRVIPLDPALI